MNKDFVYFISREIGEEIENFHPISGGDISHAYMLETRSGQFFCKVNYEDFAYDLFIKEKEGLQAIQRSGCIRTPEIISLGEFENDAYLLMEFIQNGPKNKVSMQALGISLASMHIQQVDDQFGWETNNYIGKLEQKNGRHEDWISFYVQERLGVQFKLAADLQLIEQKVIPSMKRMMSFCENHFPKVFPSLLHGDLWGGNYLISVQGIPYLIDPAVYYGHSEIDLAMTELFGGFSDGFYNAYYEINPQESGYSIRRDIYQLYYYLVHLNLFGRSYYAPVMNIVKKYFK